MVNFKHLFNTGDKELDEPFIFASQATQVYYVQDPIDADWFAVLKSKQRDMYDMEERLDNSTEIGSFLPDLDAHTQVNVSIGGSCVRTDIDGIMIVENQPSKRKVCKRKRNGTERDIVDEESENSYEESDNPINDEEQPIGHQNIRKGRGPTLKKNIYSSSGGPKICITLNEYGQPVGRNSKEFGNFIGTLVRKNIPVSCEDWRLVDSKKKFELWTKVKEYYEVDESGIDYVITSAAKKWREFKADLKNKYFDETLSFEELIAKRDERVKESDWEWLITYWMSPEAEVRTNRGKDNRSKLTMSHAAGSKSYARVGHELAEQQGRPARRDEIYVRTHTRKNKEGDIVPLPGAEIFINKFEEAVAENPELKDRSIEDGDLYAHVFGEKEPRGRIRGLGLGPTPQDVGTPGTQMKISTKLQMALQARSQSEQEVRALRQDMNQMKEKMDQIYQMMVAAQGVQHIESPSQHGSNSRQNSRVHRSDEVAHDYNGNNHSQNMVEDDLQLTRRVASTVGRLRNREDVNTIEEQSRRRDIATMVPQRNHGSSQNADDNPIIFSSITSYLCFII
ncbi:uncharacterized protein [Zea mays]|uniref:uncharacterized protein n=1 Tax=Zea mays TaxID=4577 RepID=UPI001653312C|nr:uncharacterized protein LOC103634081 [Zea mays]